MRRLIRHSVGEASNQLCCGGEFGMPVRQVQILYSAVPRRFQPATATWSVPV
jgi:hypothetical protein